MEDAALRADCARCAALCCVAFAFDRRSGAFPIDKPNGIPCPNLARDNSCRIYEEREDEGFLGCGSYECYGAGQRVTQEVFGGRSWRDESAILPDMIRAFVVMVRVQELLVLLNEAETMPLDAGERAMLQELQDALSPADGWSTETLAGFERSGLENRTRSFLTSLRRHFDMAG